MKAMMNLGSKFTYDDVLQARDAALKVALAASDRVTVDRAEADAQLARDQHQDLIQRQLVYLKPSTRRWSTCRRR